MLFNSIEFLIFFLAVTTAYFCIPHKYRWFLLLVSSCYFYMAFVPIYILILGFTIVIDYYAGILIENADGQKKKLFLIISLLANVGVLAVFKYYNFINENLSFLLKGFGVTNPLPFLSILLPIGLSFHTFQAMSYTIEVYRGNQKAERHFGIYSLYVMFYPQLVAGPIERPQNLLHQFREKFSFDYERVYSGLRQMAWGTFKKVVIADRLAVYVNQVYADIDQTNSVSIFLAMCFFVLQVYADFSGYSDIAIGAARVMGFKLMKNFDRPFSSKSTTEFWRKWHISLSTWFGDYFFNPIAISKRNWGVWSVVYASMITFLVLGLWHGANWTFIIFGGLQGLMLSLELLTAKARKKIRKKIPVVLNNGLGIIYTFLFFGFCSIFFRSENVTHASRVITKLFSFDINLNIAQLCANKGLLNMALTFFVLLLFYISSFLPDDLKFRKRSSNFIFLLTILFLIIILGKNGTGEFIYFQF